LKIDIFKEDMDKLDLKGYKWHFKEHVAVNDLFQAKNKPIPCFKAEYQ
jgi:hypothetical protein